MPSLRTGIPSRRRAGSSCALEARKRRRERLAVEPLEGRTLLTYGFGFVAGFGCYDIRSLAIATDSAGNAYITGSFRGTVDFDPTPGTTNLTSTGDHDLFVAKFTSTGSLVWAKSMPGGSSGSVGQGNAIAVDTSGQIVITGEYAGTVNFNPTGAATNLSSPGHFDVFIARLNADGSLNWAVDVPGSPNSVDSGNALALDGSGNIYVAGSYANTANFGGTPLTTGDSNNLFVAKLSSSGSFVWARGAGSVGQANSAANGIAVDSSGRVDVTGFFAGTVDFNPTNLANPSPLTANGIRDIFLAQWDTNGNLVWNKGIGGSDFDQGMAVAVDNAGNLYTTGAFSGTVDFDPGAATANLTSGGDYSAYVAKYTASGQLGWAKAFTITAGSAIGNDVALDSAGNVVTTGWFENTVDFDTSGASANLTSAGTEDVYVSQLDPNGNYIGAQSAGSWDFDVATSLALTSSNTILITGDYIGTPTFGTTVLTNYNRRNAFVASLTTGGTGLQAPSAPVLEAGSDSGASNSDDITSASAPVFDVTTAGATNTVELLRNGQVVASRTGPGALTDPGPIPEGQATYAARQRDNTAHVSPLSSTLTVTFDRTSPATPTAPALATADDSGATGDGITNVRQPHLVGSTEPGALVQLLNAANALLGSATAAPDGSYSVLLASPLADGTYSFHVQVQDAAGNMSGSSTSLTITIDATPPATPSVPSLLPADDSGSAGDGLTNVRTPHLVGTAMAGLGVQLVNATGVVLNTTTAAPDGSYSLAPSSALADGSYAFSVRVQDVAGNTSATSAPLNLTIDATPPATTAAPVLASADDSGAQGDGITNIRQPHLTGAAEGNALVQLLNTAGAILASATAVANGAYTLGFTAPLADGVYSLHVQAQDAAGNTSAPSASLSLTIDATPPTAPSAPALLFSEDSGAQGDNLTNVRQPHLTGSAEAGSAVTLLSVVGVSLGTAVALPSGSYTIVPTSPLADGSYVVHVQAQDAAGNVSPSGGTLALTIDATPPGTPNAPVLLPADDTGTPGDGITTVRQPHLTGNAEPLATVQIVDAGGHVQGTGAASASGSYSVQFAAPLADGTYIVRVQAQDAAGNSSSPSATFSITIGTGGQANLGMPALVAADDSGALGDYATNARQPRLTGSAAAAAHIQVVNAINSVLGSTFAAPDGSYIVSFTSPLADGAYVLHVQSLDNANNVTGTSPNFTLTIDATSPATPATPSLLPADDSGTLGDGLTRVRQPHLTGTVEPYAAVQLVDAQGNVLGTTAAGANGSYSVSPTSPLADGAYGLRVRAIDAADNMSATSASLAIAIDATPPAAPVAPVLAPSDDSGAAGDNLTNVTQPHLTGTCEPNALVQLIDATGNVLGTVNAAPSGSYSVGPTSSLGSGLHAIRIIAQDAAGNGSTPSAELDVTIDVTPPQAPTTPIILGIDDTGTTGDGLTIVRQPRLIGLTEPRATVRIFNATTSAILGTMTTGSDGSYIVAFASPLADGSYSVYIQAQDSAGNTSSPSGTLALRIDATPPATPAAPALLAADDTGVLGDGRTTVRQPHLVGNTEPNAKVQIVDSLGTVLGSGSASAGGAYSVQFTAAVAIGTYSVRVQATDAAGNASLVSPPLSLTIISAIPPTPAAPVLQASDDTGKLGDNITSIRQPHLAGTTLAGLTVDLLSASGTVLASATAGSDGSYAVQYPTPLANGSISLQVRVRDGAGNTSATSPALKLTLVTTTGDYDSDGKADLASYQPSNATWSISGSLGAITTRSFGAPNLDIPVPADYDGAGKTEIAVFRPTTCQWFILGPSGGRSVSFGGPGDIPVPGDYDGDGKADVAVYRPSTAEWFIFGSSAGPFRKQFGGPGDTPVPADYDGDGKTDCAVFRTSAAMWYEMRSTAGNIGVQFGAPRLDLPMSADYDADGKADPALYRPTTAQWFVQRSSAGGMSRSFGAPGLDVPIPSDYDGDGQADVAVYRSTTAQWLIYKSTTGPKGQVFGTPNVMIPLSASIAYRMQAVSALAAGITPGVRVASAPANSTPLYVVLASSGNASKRTEQLAQATDLALEAWPGLQLMNSLDR